MTQTTPPPSPPDRPQQGETGPEAPRTIWQRIVSPLDMARRLIAQHITFNWSSFFDRRDPLIWLLALIAGIAVGYAAIGFRLAIGAVQYLWVGTSAGEAVAMIAALPWWLVLFTPVAGGLAVGLILHRFIPQRYPLSVADLMEASATGKCRLPLRPGLASAALTAISLGSGASAGREGPIVHLGATLSAVLFGRFSLLPSAQRTLLASGAAAAVAASFNAPIAGVLFAHEVVLRHYALRAFVPITIASVIATIIARAYFGNFPAFIIPPYQITSNWEFPAFALLGLTAALVAVLAQYGFIIAERVALAVPIPDWLRPALGGALIGAIGIFYPQVLGVGYDTTDAALKQALPLALLFQLLFAKTLATAITFASRFGGGVFSPSLYLGAVTGGAFGIIAAGVFPEAASSHGLYTLLGMGAVASVFLGAPISTTLIVLELTGGYKMTIALLLTISMANGLAQALHAKSFFFWQLRQRGVILHEGAHDLLIKTITVASFMRPAVADASGGRELVERALRLTPQTSLEVALKAFADHGVDDLAVVARDGDGHEIVVGRAYYVDAIAAYNKALVEVIREEHG